MIPETYKIQNGCHNCKKVFKFCDYESEPEFYCTFKATKRPLCGSLVLEEIFCPKKFNAKLYDKRYAAWTKWSEGREVNPAGICENYR